MAWLRRQKSYGVSVTAPITRPTQSLVRRSEEGAVAAVVLDHEEPHQEAGGRHGDEKGEPVADAERGPHGEPDQCEATGRHRQLEHASPGIGLAIAAEN